VSQSPLQSSRNYLQEGRYCRNVGCGVPIVSLLTDRLMYINHRTYDSATHVEASWTGQNPTGAPCLRHSCNLVATTVVID
jgi:hypothetical protein